MARLDQLPEPMRSHLAALECPTFEQTRWVPGPAPAESRVALISTAGVHCRQDRPFVGITGEYRIIPGDAAAEDLVMSHVSTNFDRTGFMQDWNVVFPLDRLRELADEGAVGALADYHYSFMGAADPREMEPMARHVADLMKKDEVNLVLLVPV